MENPATWGEAEKVIDKALGDFYDAVNAAEPIIGLSLARCVADALRAADLLKDK